ncbi:MAG: response regulator transcription factor [Alistipes sp.]|nr:response regulator transcription factor [Alistipes sp.]MBR3826595.1 response regulator transcription factor [Alistipes sp.]
MKVLIVEDEIPAQINLKKLIDKCCPDSRIVMTLSSVRSTIKWLEENPEGADVIFMDVELSDGVCFDIFDKINITAEVIITTAYDNYAVNAFKVNSVDYLLKPIEERELTRAWERCRERLEQRTSPSLEALIDIVSRAGAPKDKEYKKRFIVKTGEKIIIIPIDDIAYCYSEDKSTYAICRNGSRRLLDYSLDTVQEMLDPKLFFRISRSYIVSINSIENISKYLGTRLKLQLTPRSEDDVVVSRSRTSDFLEWLDNN